MLVNVCPKTVTARRCCCFCVAACADPREGHTKETYVGQREGGCLPCKHHQEQPLNTTGYAPHLTYPQNKVDTCIRKHHLKNGEKSISKQRLDKECWCRTWKRREGFKHFLAGPRPWAQFQCSLAPRDTPGLPPEYCWDGTSHTNLQNLKSRWLKNTGGIIFWSWGFQVHWPVTWLAFRRLPNLNSWVGWYFFLLELDL